MAFVALLMTSTVAWATTAPDESKTWPVTVALGLCACTPPAARRNKTRIQLVSRTVGCPPGSGGMICLHTHERACTKRLGKGRRKFDNSDCEPKDNSGRED